ncbi:MAG: TspO/MBR family protein [Candidatus Woesearchaeota archaeon]
MKAKIDYLKLIASIIICQLAGIIGSVFTISSVSTWYVTLNKPFFNPPGWIFGPVWTILYLLMGISLYLVWTNKDRTRKALAIFATQLVLNSLWSILFFGLQSPFLAAMEIIVLWGAILLSIAYFYRISRPAAYLLIPYILWVTFAAVLNLSIFLLNT